MYRGKGRRNLTARSSGWAHRRKTREEKKRRKIGGLISVKRKSFEKENNNSVGMITL